MKLSASAWRATTGGFAQSGILGSIWWRKEVKFLALWEGAGCSKHTGDDDQTQIAQSTLLSDTRMQLQQKSCAQCDFTASNSQTRLIKASLVKPACTTALLQISVCARLKGRRKKCKDWGLAEQENTKTRRARITVQLHTALEINVWSMDCL